MQVKKFEAPTIQEALDNIKRELGPEAVILQTKKNRRGFGLLAGSSVEVTVAVSDRSVEKKKTVENRLPVPTREAVKKLPATRQAEFYEQYQNKFQGKTTAKSGDQHLQAAATTRDKVDLQRRVAPVVESKPALSQRVTPTRYIDIPDSPRAPQPPTPALEKEVQALRAMIQEMKEHPPAKGAESANLFKNDSAQEAFDLLVMNGMEKRYAYALVKHAAFESGSHIQDQLASEILDSTPTLGVLNLGTPNSHLALVGPTGVGKTLLIAKIAASLTQKKGQKVALIHLDPKASQSFEALGSVARLLHLPFRNVSTSADLQSALNDFATFDAVLIDTPGSSPKDVDSIKNLQALFQQMPQLRIDLVLSVVTRDSELYDAVSRFSALRPAAVAFTKLDESTLFGTIYNVVQKSKLPLSCFSTGQKVPEDFEEASAERVASLILEI